MVAHADGPFAPRHRLAQPADWCSACTQIVRSRVKSGRRRTEAIPEARWIM
jgi:hypothetical protein